MYANRRVCVFLVHHVLAREYLGSTNQSQWGIKKTKKEKDLKLIGEGYQAMEVKLGGMGSNMITIHSRHVWNPQITRRWILSRLTSLRFMSQEWLHNCMGKCMYVCKCGPLSGAMTREQEYDPRAMNRVCGSSPSPACVGSSKHPCMYEVSSRQH